MFSSVLEFNVKDPKAMAIWELAHSADHDEIRQAVKTQKSVSLVDYVLYPVNWRDWDKFADWHQQVHNDMNGTLNLAGTDLTSVDFNDAKAAAEWHQNHFTEHLAARSTLGI